MGKRRTVLILTLLLTSTAFASPKRRAVGGDDSWPSHPLLEAARLANEPQYDFARNAGARVLLAADNSTFALYWSPTAAVNTPVIVTLPGSDAFATAEFFHWYSLAAERGYALLALQWWMGKPDDYLDDETIYALIAEMLGRVGASHDRNLLHGFSRGSARSYAIAFFDRRTSNPWFLMNIANSGGAQTTYPLYRDIEQGRYGSNVFAGTHWVLYCGENDPNPTISGCPAMRESQTWLTRNGGDVRLFIDDPAGGHGGFEQNPANMRQALDVFAGLLSKL
ncbi:MAG TPA: hypothetical protein VMU84_02330 [Thermoanaerobaculia bacterium]|nr:hypothetical protein [Thermoanaerobaculia bacterium]